MFALSAKLKLILMFLHNRLMHTESPVHTCVHLILYTGIIRFHLVLTGMAIIETYVTRILNGLIHNISNSHKIFGYTVAMTVPKMLVLCYSAATETATSSLPHAKLHSICQ